MSRVPKMALTVGVGTVMDAREVVVLISGASKARALYECIENGISHMWTVSALQLHARACIVCDEDATLELKVKTVKYFKGIQKAQEILLGKPMEGTPVAQRTVSFTGGGGGGGAGGSGGGGGGGGGATASSPAIKPVAVVLPHGVPGSTRAGLNERGEFTLQSAAL
jgi:uncharacterized membrane protein YgcG